MMVDCRMKPTVDTTGRRNKGKATNDSRKETGKELN